MYPQKEAHRIVIQKMRWIKKIINTLQEISASLNNDPSFITTVVNSLSTKANTTDTFLKTVVSNDVYLALDANKRIVGTSTANQFKF